MHTLSSLSFDIVFIVCRLIETHNQTRQSTKTPQRFIWIVLIQELSSCETAINVFANANVCLTNRRWTQTGIVGMNNNRRLQTCSSEVLSCVCAFLISAMYILYVYLRWRTLYTKFTAIDTQRRCSLYFITHLCAWVFVYSVLRTYCSHYLLMW